MSLEYHEKAHKSQRGIFLRGDVNPLITPTLASKSPNPPNQIRPCVCLYVSISQSRSILINMLFRRSCRFQSDSPKFGHCNCFEKNTERKFFIVWLFHLHLFCSVLQMVQLIIKNIAICFSNTKWQSFLSVQFSKQWPIFGELL